VQRLKLHVDAAEIAVGHARRNARAARPQRQLQRCLPFQLEEQAAS
jgi:hypothetical protein